jgi:hypothetical protein
MCYINQDSSTLVVCIYGSTITTTIYPGKAMCFDGYSSSNKQHVLYSIYCSSQPNSAYLEVKSESGVILRYPIPNLQKESKWQLVNTCYDICYLFSVKDKTLSLFGFDTCYEYNSLPKTGTHIVLLGKAHFTSQDVSAVEGGPYAAAFFNKISEKYAEQKPYPQTPVLQKWGKGSPYVDATWN